MSEEQQANPEEVVATTVSRESFEEQIKATSHAPEDSAAAFFMKNQKIIRPAIDAMSQNQLRRFLYNLISHPFILPGQELKSQLEKEAFHVANNMVENKILMRLAMEIEKVENAQKIIEENKANETKTETQVEETTT